jgi:DeoR/GlpR family transcriptional regulator of sugar metabolism
VEFLENSDLDILTNSFPIAAKLFATSRNRITLPGGTIFREQNIVLSPFGTTASSFPGQQADRPVLRTQPLRHDGSRSAHLQARNNC